MNFPQFLGPSATAFSQKAAIQRTMNMYLEPLPDGENENSVALIKSPGISSWGNVASAGRSRGMYALNGHLFTVVGNTIYDLDPSAAALRQNGTYGPIADDGTHVRMAADPNTLVLVSNGVLYRLAGALTTPTLPCTPIALAFLKNYFIVLADSLNQFFFSDDSALTWDAADVQTAEANANAFIAMIAHQQLLWILGNRITQVFAVTANPNAPFQPQDNGVIPEGIVAPASLKALGESLIWLAENKDHRGHLVKTNGYIPQRVSTPAFENALRAYGRIDDAIGWTYEQNDQQFYRLTFPAQNATWEYNATLNHLTELGYWNQATGLYEAHRGLTCAQAFGSLFVGDRANGKIYRMSPDYYDDAGNPLRWFRRAPHLVQENKRVDYHGMFEIAGEKGVGLDLPVGSAGYDPQVYLRWSDDGGRNWSNSYGRSLGKNGAFKQRTYWGPGLGIARDRVWELSGSDAVKTVFTAATFDASVLDS